MTTATLQSARRAIAVVAPLCVQITSRAGKVAHRSVYGLPGAVNTLGCRLRLP